jgi:hypothetical protein
MRFIPAKVPRAAWLLPIIGLLAGLGFSFLVTPVYVSTATLVMSEEVSAPNSAKIHHALVGFFMWCQEEVLSRTSLSGIIQDTGLNLYRDERQRLPLEDVIEAMRPHVHVKIVDKPGYARETSTVFEIAFSGSNPLQAQQVTQKLITRFWDVAAGRTRSPEFHALPPAQLSRLERLEARLAALEARAGMPVATQPEPSAEAVPIHVGVLDAASLPAYPAWPNRLLFAGIGFAAGILALGFIGVAVSAR